MDCVIRLPISILSPTDRRCRIAKPRGATECNELPYVRLFTRLHRPAREYLETLRVRGVAFSVRNGTDRLRPNMLQNDLPAGIESILG